MYKQQEASAPPLADKNSAGPYSLSSLLSDGKTTLLGALSDWQQLRTIFDSLPASDRVNLLQTSLNKCEDRLLHFAIRLGSTECVKGALQYLNQRSTLLVSMIQNKHGDTAMHLAVRLGRDEAMKTILTAIQPEFRVALLKLQDKQINNVNVYDCGDPLNCVIVESKTPLPSDTVFHIAASSGNTTALKYILDSLPQADRLTLLSIRNRIGFTALHSAVKEENIGSLKVMLESVKRESVLSLIMIPDIWGSSARHKASNKSKLVAATNSASSLDWESVDSTDREVLLHVPSVSKTAMNSTFKKAADATSFKAIQQWVHNNGEGKRSIHIPESLGDTPLMMAFRKDTAECFGVLLCAIPPEHRLPTLLKITDECGDTALHRAVAKRGKGHVQAIVAALETHENDSYLARKGKNRDTALHRASAMNHGDHVACMLTSASNAGRMALLEAENSLGNTPLNIAVHKEYVDVLSAIVKSLSILSGAELYRFLDKKAVFHALSKHGALKSIQLLMMKLEDESRKELVSQKDRHKKTAAKLASTPEVKNFFAWSELQYGNYLLSTPPSVVIINNGGSKVAEDECMALQQSFTEYNIEPMMKTALTKAQIVQCLQEVSTTHGISALIVAIIGYGQKGAVHAYDGTINVQDVTQCINSKHLEGKPKVMIMNAFQTDSATGNQEVLTSSSGSTPSDGSNTGEGKGLSDFMMLSISAAKDGNVLKQLSQSIRCASSDESMDEAFLKLYRQATVDTDDIDKMIDFTANFTRNLFLAGVFNPKAKLSKSGKLKPKKK